MIFVEEATEQRLHEERVDVAHLPMPRAIFGDKWDTTLLNTSFGWLNRWGGNGSLSG